MYCNMLKAFRKEDSPLGSKWRVFLFDPYPMLGMITPHPLNFRRTLESIPFGRLHDFCKRRLIAQTAQVLSSKDQLVLSKAPSSSLCLEP